MKFTFALVCMTFRQDLLAPRCHPIKTRTFHRPSRLLRVFSSSCVWFIRLSVSCVTGLSNFFDFMALSSKTAVCSHSYVTANMVAR